MSDKANLTMAERLEIWKASKLLGKPDSDRSKRGENVSGEKLSVDNSSNDVHSKRLKKSCQNKCSESKVASDEASVSQNIHPNTWNDQEDPLVEANKEIAHLTKLLHESNLKNESLQGELNSNAQAYTVMVEKMQFLDIRYHEALNSAKMNQEEVFAHLFENSIQAQRIEELEQTINRDRFETAENASEKTKKHKDEVRRLIAEREEYQTRANFMIQELNEQLAMLQQVAMQRIEVLEKELLSETTKSRNLEEEMENMRSGLAGRALTPPRTDVTPRQNPARSRKLNKGGREGAHEDLFVFNDDEDGDSCQDLDDSAVTECADNRSDRDDEIDEYI